MSDITTVWRRDMGRADWDLSTGVLQQGSDLQTAVLISIFTDRLAGEDDIIPDGTTDPRGWIGDEGEQYPIGSRIWLLDRSKEVKETLDRAQDYLAEALQWLIDDGVVAGFEITTNWIRKATLGAVITAYQPNGTPVGMNFEWAWSTL